MKKWTIIASLILLFISPLRMSANEPTKKPPSPCTIYFSADLFSMRQKVFNAELVSILENKYHYKVYLPQRDGFEFTILQNILSKKLEKDEVDKAQAIIIYLLDMGYFLLKSNVVVALLDEQLDPGVIVEISYANLINKYVIGIRTDVRSPYGINPITGTHFFTVMQLNDFVYMRRTINSKQSVDIAFDDLARIVHQKIASYTYNGRNICDQPPINSLENKSEIARIARGAKLLFDNMTPVDMHTEAGLNLIVSRYVKNRNELEKLYPTTTNESSIGR